MAHDHRMNSIADPYLTQRSTMGSNQLDYSRIADISNMARRGTDVGTIRSIYDMHSTESAGLQGRSNMQNEYDDDEDRDLTTDADLMPDTNAPIDRTKLAFGESGHGFSVRKGREGQ